MTHGARTADYDFELNPARIAQEPVEPRDACKLMVVNRATGDISHRIFHDLPALMRAGDALVLNTTRVFRARLLGTRPSGARGEVLLLRQLDADRWEAMVSPGGKLRPGRMLTVAPGFEIDILEQTERRTRIVRLRAADGDVGSAIERHGHVPLPPYIARPDTALDADRYQTVYAAERGSVAAPTAGLHFTPRLLDDIARRGVERVNILLHVGAGTFKPVEVDEPSRHVMHEEWFSVTDAAARALTETRARGGAIWAVGTTAARTLESLPRQGDAFVAAHGDTRIFIHPPHIFHGVDKLITNFHLPRSTLLMLVAAFAGYDLTMRAYREAIDADYRFYSYGDAMAIV
ncbi:MAG TPA: tRNA preQ1(34) S-adenosylmethionine ribosyltransferase-isomerase QueA [Gemmatimonadaceae bacterium]|nr:tRNA preQ1(34) S-adenosylmethionine ribosyltransferase-isomerase QueA [Gemmatimonadaceae bacterium]